MIYAAARSNFLNDGRSPARRRRLPAAPRRSRPSRSSTKGEQLVALRDPAGYTPSVVMLPGDLVEIVALFDGKRTRSSTSRPS